MFKICVQPTAKIRDFCLNFKKNGKNKVKNMKNIKYYRNFRVK